MEKTRRRPGPVPDMNTVRTTVVLDRELADWGKNQPGGLSDLLRRLLREAAGESRPIPRRDDPTETTTQAAFAGPIADIWDTPEEDEAWAHLAGDGK